MFIALHGKGGEDGQIQQYLDRKKVPYVGSGPRASYRAYNKIASKKILTKKNIPTAEYAELHPAAWQRQMSSIGLPVCVKPVYEGSSIGVFFVEDLKKSAEKVKRAFRMYGSMMAEKKIDGREFTVGILGRRALPVIELKPKRQFYDYCAKYTKGMTRYEVPARIPRRLARKMQKIALRTHAALGLRDLSRVDLMLDRQGRIFVLEANSIPGFTEFSLLPKAAAAAGIPFGEVCLGLLGRALKRSMTRKRQN
ncbi:MAG: hypothetical protein A2Z83_01375 [Omnitrophica bacterium GWA2_52_8]|nr:MAG: hypothetical protein A2Z83_01375 [Omnitrophica bacterium GWA2_52_8]